jgi:hypothetical protein
MEGLIGDIPWGIGYLDLYRWMTAPFVMLQYFVINIHVFFLSNCKRPSPGSVNSTVKPEQLKP